MIFFDKDLASIQESRILVEYTKDAKNILTGFSQKKLDKILDGVYHALMENHEELALLSVEETGYGVFEDECFLLKNILKKTKDSLLKMKCVGTLSENSVDGTKELGIPLGVGAILCSDISPVTIVASMALQLIKTGNVAIYLPSEKSSKVVNKAVSIIIKSAEEAGMPKGAISCLETVSYAGRKAIIDSSYVNFIINASVEEHLEDCFFSKKIVFYGSDSHSPVFIERTADIKRAVGDVIQSRSFNNGMMMASEQYMIVDKYISDNVKKEFINNGAYFMNETEENMLLNFLAPNNLKMDKEYIGKSAKWLAKQSGFSVPDKTKLLISEKHYIADRNPYTKTLHCPIIAYYVENDWVNACERCMKLLVEETNGHTLAIHSKDENIIEEFAVKKPVARMIVNTQTFMGAIGLTTNLFPSMVLGGLTTGIGATADNLSPINLIYKRQVGYGRSSKVDTKKVDQDKILELVRNILQT